MEKKKENIGKRQSAEEERFSRWCSQRRLLLWRGDLRTESGESDGVSHSDVWRKSLLGREGAEAIIITHITVILFLHFNNTIHSSLLLAFLPLFIITHITITSHKHSAQHPVGGASVLGEQS